MGRYAGRFVVETHAHAQRAAVKFAERGIKKPTTAEMYGQVSTITWHDNSDRLLYDMDRYGVDVCILQSGGLGQGMDNDLDLKIAEQYPDKFAVLCFPTTFLNKCARGEAKWSFEKVVKETEGRLKTGKYKGMGQGLPATDSPGAFRHLWAKKDRKRKGEFLSEGELLDRYRAFYDLARKYEVAVAGIPYGTMGEMYSVRMLAQLIAEYPDVPTVAQIVGKGEGGQATKAKIQDLCAVAGRAKNLFLEMGCAPAELWDVPLSDPNVGVTQLVWGTDWGSSQYVYGQPGRPIRGESFTSYVDSIYKWGPSRYQVDLWGWSLHQIDKLRDVLTQDEINLILGGNAARVFKLDVPYTRLFPEGRADLWGIYWDDHTPFIPHKQVREKRTQVRKKRT